MRRILPNVQGPWSRWEAAGLLMLFFATHPPVHAVAPNVLWKIENGSSVNGLAFSPDGAILAHGGLGKRVTLYQAATGEKITTLEEQPGNVWSVAFSPDGQFFASAGGMNDKSIWVWRTNGWELLGLLPYEHYDGASAVAFSPDSSLIASGGYDGMVHISQVSDGATLRSMKHGSLVPSRPV
jgi:WD40 repeat protein